MWSLCLSPCMWTPLDRSVCSWLDPEGMYHQDHFICLWKHSKSNLVPHNIIDEQWYCILIWCTDHNRIVPWSRGQLAQIACSVPSRERQKLPLMLFPVTSHLTWSHTTHLQASWQVYHTSCMQSAIQEAFTAAPPQWNSMPPFAAAWLMALYGGCSSWWVPGLRLEGCQTALVQQPWHLV